MTVIGDFAHRWRRGLALSLALLVVAAVGGCGLEDTRPESGAAGEGSTVARLSHPPPVPPCERFLPDERGNFIRWSRDGSSIVFYRPDGLYRVEADGPTVQLIDTEPTRGWHAFDLAPDGQHTVYSTCPKGSYDLVRARIDGASSQWLTIDPVTGTKFPAWVNRVSRDANFPAWSPDGARIAYTAGDLYTMTADGSGHRLIRTGAYALESAPPRWSPDSQQLAVTGYLTHERLVRALYTVGADRSNRRVLATGVVSAPTWSPDGHWLAYARVHRGDVILAAIRADGTDERLVTTIWDWDSAYPYPWRGERLRGVWVRTLAWSPDGNHLLYSCGNHLCVVTSEGRFVGRTPVVVAEGNIGAWSPDGRRIAVTGLGLGDQVLYTIAPDGGQMCYLVVARYDQANRNVVERVWRLVFGLEAEYPLVAVRDCGAAA